MAPVAPRIAYEGIAEQVLADVMIAIVQSRSCKSKDLGAREVSREAIVEPSIKFSLDAPKQQHQRIIVIITIVGHDRPKIPTPSSDKDSVMSAINSRYMYSSTHAHM